MTNVNWKGVSIMHEYVCPNCSVEIEFQVGTEEPLNIAGVIGPEACLDCGLPVDPQAVIADYLASGEEVL